MEIIDYLPHRLLANRSLKREAQKVNDRYEEVKREIARKRCESKIEIEKAREAANARVNEAVRFLNEQLNQDAEIISNQAANMCEYSRLCFERDFLDAKRQGIEVEKKTIEEYIVFLTSRMTLIGGVIAALEDRKTILAQRVDVSDIIRLLTLSGADIILDETESAETLLEKVSAKTKEKKENFLLHSTLKKLERLVQEREELRPMIQYIEWLIEQKKRLSQEWKDLRDHLQSELSPIKVRLDECVMEQSIVIDQIESQARKIREIWAKPLLYLSADLTEIKMTIDDKHKEKNRIEQAIQSSKKMYPDDKYKRKERKEQYEEKEKIKSEIETLKRKKADIEKRQGDLSTIKLKYIQLCQSVGTALLSDLKDYKSVEYTLMVQRIQELKTIEAEGKREAEAEYIATTNRLLQEKKERLSGIQAEIEQAEQRCAALKRRICRLSYDLDLLKKKDKKSRFFLTRWFKKTEEIRTAEEELKNHNHAKSKADQALKKLQSKKEEQDAFYDKQISEIKIVYRHPTYDERREMEKLEQHRTRLVKIYEARRKNHESKN